MINLAILTYKY